MKRLTPIITALALTVCGSAFAGGDTPAYTPPPVSQTPEAQAAFKAMRSIEIKVETGMNLAEYRQEVASMAVEIAPLDELLQARHAVDQSTRLQTIKAEYVLASRLWSACIWDIVHDHGSICTEASMHTDMNKIWTDAKRDGQALRAEMTNGAT